MVESSRGKTFAIHTSLVVPSQHLHPFKGSVNSLPQSTLREPVQIHPSLSSEGFQLEFVPNYWDFKKTRCFSATNSLHNLPDRLSAHLRVKARSNETSYNADDFAEQTVPIPNASCTRRIDRKFSIGRRKALLPTCGPDSRSEGEEQPRNTREASKARARKAKRRGRTGATAAFVSVLQEPLLTSNNLQPRPPEDLRALFNEIDVDGDGRLTETELRTYAEKHGLPTTYVREFLDLARHSDRRWDGCVRWPWRPPTVASRVPGPGTVDSPGKGGPVAWARRLVRSATAPLSVEFCEFREFVERKDDALRESFARMDVNGDGEITMAELERGMRCVRVMSGGQYRPVRNLCIARMMKRLHKGRSSTIRYQEFRDFFTLLPSSEYLMDYWLESSCTPSVDLGSKFQVATPAGSSALGQYSVEPRGSPWNHLLAGGLAGAVSRTITAPLETLRLQMMVNAAAVRGAGGSSLSAQARALYQQAGWRAFFRGNLTNVVRSAPQKAIDFFAFEGYKHVLLRAAAGPIGMQLMTAGALAGATSTLILYPLDVVRSRLTIQTSFGTYKGIVDALTRISREEGIVSLYRGLRPSIVSIIPEAGITYGAFDILKRTYLRVMKTEKVPLVPTMVCGVASASTGQFVAYPLELVARRLQVAGGSATAHEIFLKIVQEEGVRGLYRGIVPATLKMIPMAIISFSVYESAKSALMWLSQLEEARKIEAASLAEEKQSRIQIIRQCPST